MFLDGNWFLGLLRSYRIFFICFGFDSWDYSEEYGFFKSLIVNKRDVILNLLNFKLFYVINNLYNN